MIGEPITDRRAHPLSRLRAFRSVFAIRIEEAFGWAEMVAGLRKARHRGSPKPL